MPEASQPAQNEQLHVKDDESQETANGANDCSISEGKVSAAEAARVAALKARKRTKTGCLTCRKRRIKCGEERPTCKNCVKSKRDCEGYIPRVIFKDPLGAFRPGQGQGQQGIAVRTPQGSGQNGATTMYGSISTSSTDTPIAPRLPQYVVQSGPGQSTQGNYFNPNSYTYGSQPYNIPIGDQTSTPQYAPPGLHETPVAGRFYQPEIKPEIKAEVTAGSYPALQRHATGESDSSIEIGHHDLAHTWSYGSRSSTAQHTELPVAYAQGPILSTPGQIPQNFHWTGLPQDAYLNGKPPFPSHALQEYPVVAESVIGNCVHDQVEYQNHSHGERIHHPWVGEPEDDYFDVNSDDEDYETRAPVGGPLAYNLGPLIAMSANHHNGGIRSMTNFLNEPNVLAAYQPSYAASPLMDPQTARIFCHFITATAPTLAVCERRPSNPSVIFSGVPVPKSQRALWSYTLPMLALTHQGLLHAMLALASLHISKLQQTSATPSLKHYHYALRRVAKALGNPKKRKDVATLAATLLLGFYEVTTAEHNKWNSHLSGARELVMDIDFAGMARKIEAHRCRQEEAEAYNTYQTHYGYYGNFQQPSVPRASEEFPARADRQLDENLISTILGYKIRYNQYGQIIDENEPVSRSDAPLTPQDIENFEIQCDLYWWYAKQDMYQSLVSGNRLLLSYDRWSLCPPRAPVGRLDAVYGSLDHLLLMMGRLANFASKDLPRKLRAQREAEKRSRSQTNQNQSQTTQPSPQQGPNTMPNGMQARPMYGMIPDPGPVRLPSGFDQAKHDSIYTAPVSSDGESLDTATCQAEIEWTNISEAFDVFFNSLGPAYAPLEPEHMTPMATPFGPALYYRSYAIACILTMYYCGRIVCMRVKPGMPPAAMAAAGVAAQSTAHWANTLGRVVAGIQPVDSTVSINPHHGAALMDCCMGLFQAGVQYRDPAQRGWTITKLRDVARLTGWQTSALIAAGCERAWMRAAEMGKGPPYVMRIEQEANDDRVAGRGRGPRDFDRPAKDNNDRRFITVNAGTRVHWALGILGVEEDMRGMKLD